MIDWERRLKREGLGHLDTPHGDDIGVSNRGSGTPKSQATADHREGNEAEIDHRRSILATRKLTHTQRRIWQHYAQGYGRRAIAERTGIPENTIRQAIADVEAGAAGAAGAVTPRDLVPHVDARLLLRLVLA